MNWKLETYSGDIFYNPGDGIVMNSDIELIAQWELLEPETYLTVKFIFPNAAATIEIQVPLGWVIPKPTYTPDKTSDKYNAKVRAWSLSLTEYLPYPFDTGGFPIHQDMTLYALYEPFKIGDIGPGGGTIVHRDSAGFTVQGYTWWYNGTGYNVPPRTCYYLEAAPPSDTTTFNTWTISGKQSVFIDTFTQCGYGQQNTGKILANDPDAPAAKYCVDYRSEHRGDWFLPSSQELNLMRLGGATSGYPIANYWTSNQSTNGASAAFVYYMGTGVIQNASKTQAGPITLPMRAF